VIANPLSLPEFGADSYKLTSAGGHTLGSISSDTLASVSGTLGAPPPSIPLKIVAREPGADGKTVSLDSLLADERSLGIGSGLSLIAPLGASQALETLLRDFGPVTLSMCFRVKLRDRRERLGFCNPYFDGTSPIGDVAQGAQLLDDFDLPPPGVERVSVSLRAKRGVTSDVLLSARMPFRVRPGQRVRVELTLGRRGDGRRHLSFPIRIPRDLRPGLRTVVLSGGGGGSSFEDALILLLFGELIGGEGRPAQPHSLNQLAARIRGIHRDLGIQARWHRRDRRLVYRSDDVSFEGRARVSLFVRRPRR
jgi:hypothetical protein